MKREQCRETAPHGRHAWTLLDEVTYEPIGETYLCVGVSPTLSRILRDESD